jgi:hypothetical protein
LYATRASGAKAPGSRSVRSATARSTSRRPSFAWLVSLLIAALIVPPRIFAYATWCGAASWTLRVERHLGARIHSAVDPMDEMDEGKSLRSVVRY